jgi:3-hydroxyisobutyrate dehydrogenase-like beta-hydroxyacid dehydrogenase
MAQALGVSLPASAAAAGVFDALQNRGGAREDSAAIFDVLANS